MKKFSFNDHVHHEGQAGPDGEWPGPCQVPPAGHQGEGEGRRGGQGQ